MSDEKYTYDYPKADITTDAVIFGIDPGTHELMVLLVRRGREGEPFFGSWALPGGFLGMDEGIEDGLRREIREECGIELPFVEQLGTFGDVGRDPRGRVVTVAHLALVRPETLEVVAGDDAAEAAWFDVIQVVGWDNPRLAFDHRGIVDTALTRLRSKMPWHPVGMELLPEEFTLTELQRVYETVLNGSLDTRNFRRRLLSYGVLVELDKLRKTGGKPAQLYRFDEERYQKLREQGLDFEV